MNLAKNNNKVEMDSKVDTFSCTFSYHVKIQWNTIPMHCPFSQSGIPRMLCPFQDDRIKGITSVIAMLDIL